MAQTLNLRFIRLCVLRFKGKLPRGKKHPSEEPGSLFAPLGVQQLDVESQFLDKGLNPGHVVKSTKSHPLVHQRTPEKLVFTV